MCVLPVLPVNPSSGQTGQAPAEQCLCFCSALVSLSGTGEDEKEFPDCVFMERELLVPGGSALTGLSRVHGIAAGTSLKPGWAWAPGQHKAQDKAGV